MPNIKSPFNPYGVTGPIVCPNCGTEIQRGSMNWSFSTSKFLATGAKNWRHRDCSLEPNSIAPLPTFQSFDKIEAIKDVRTRTYCNLMDAKSALEQTNWDVKAAVKQIFNTPKTPTLENLKLKVIEEFEKQQTPPTPSPAPIIPASPTTVQTKPSKLEHHFQFPDLLKLIDARMDCYLGGSPGAGKSYSIRSAADKLGLPYGFIALSDATMPSQIFGYQNVDGDYVGTLFYDFYKNGGVLDIAELDNTNAGIFTLLNNALDNGQYFFPGSHKNEAYQIVKRHPNFVAVGNGNTFLRGPSNMFPARQRQDAAAIERFVILNWKYDTALELQLSCDIFPNAEPVVKWCHALRSIVESSNGSTRGHELVVSMRSMIKLCKLMNADFPKLQAVHMAIFKEYSQADTLLKLCPITF